MVAALSARQAGASVAVLERNPRVGKKILATGNGRCNLTNVNTGVDNYHGENPGFVTPVLSAFDVERTLGFFEGLGIAPKVEDMGKVFPMSDQASSVLDVLRYGLEWAKVQVFTDSLVTGIKPGRKGFELAFEDGRSMWGKRVVVACGGKAMPSTGSDGRGYQLALDLGHSLVEVFPALVQLKLEGGFFKQIDGVKFLGTAEVLSQGKTLASDRGDILFGNYGVSGPPILQISRRAGELLQGGRDATLKISVIDSMSFGELDHLLQRRFDAAPHKTLEFSLVGLVNKRLIPVLLKEAGIRDLRAVVTTVSERERRSIAKILTDWRFRITGTKSWPSAQVTAGGISTAEVDPETLESKLVPRLFFAGEILDIDGDCGGFNLQWAWSSGYVAGQWAAMRSTL